MDTNTVQLIEKFGTKLDGYVEVLASKAGMATEHFWPVFVRQQQIEAYSAFVLFGCLTLLFCFLAYFSFKLVKKDNSWEGIQYIMSGLLGFLLIVSIVECGRKIPQVLNPEYAAIQEVVKMIK